jgi:hypothetical protein
MIKALIQSVIQMSLINIQKNIPAGQPLWEGSKLKSTSFTYLNSEEISVQKFQATYLLYQDLMSEFSILVMDAYLDGLIENKIKIMPLNELLVETPELQRICKMLRKIILMEAATYQIAYLLNIP